MSSTNYPFDQDRSFKSFKLVDYAKQIVNYGRTYAQSELLPVDLFKAFSDPTLGAVFVQEFSYTEQYPSVDFNDEAANGLQSQHLKQLIDNMNQYYRNLFTNKIAMGLVTDIRSTIQHKGGTNDIQFTLTAKVVWFAPDFCDYV
jgi:hypothetical protein